jgi:hypothetical protein
MASTPCARCGDFVSEGAAYSDEGELVCGACEVRDQLSAGEGRAAQGIVSMAFGALALAVVSLFFNPLFLASIGSLASTVTWFTTVRKNPDYAARLGRRRLLCWLVLAVAVVLSSFDLLRLLFVMVGVSRAYIR